VSTSSPVATGRRCLIARPSWHGCRLNASPPVRTALAIVVVLSLLALSSWVMPVVAGGGASLPRPGGATSAAVAPQTPVPLNATDCGLLSSSYIAGTVAAFGWPSSYAKDIEIIWAKLCNDTTFESLMAEWGGWYWFPPVTANGTTTPGYWIASNLSMPIGGSGPPSAWGNWTNFIVTWTSWASVPANADSTCWEVPCRWSETWAGSLPGTNYTGPSLYIYEPFSAGGAPPPSSPGSPGPAGPSAVTWLGPLLGGALAVAMAILVAARVRTTRPPPPSGHLTTGEGLSTSGLVAAGSGRGSLEAPPTHPPQDTPLEPSDPLEDAF